jgi:Domain of unknown function (DUF5666)
MRSDTRFASRFAAILAIALVSACGADTKTGSNGTGSIPSERANAFVSGTLVSTAPFSIGTAEIDVGTAQIRRDETADAGASSLKPGMNLEAAGTIIGAFGAVPVMLQAGDSQSLVRGPILSVNPQGNSFTVATLTFIVDGNTLYDGANGIAALAPGDPVEVSGLPLADLRMALATRVTRMAPGDGRLSIAARIDSFSPQGLSLAGISVPGASSAAFNPPPLIGTLIRVSGNYDPASKTITSEQVSLIPPLAPANRTRVEIEGIALDVSATGAFVLRTAARDYDVTPGATATVPVAPGARVRLIGTATGPSSLVSD